MIQVDEQEDENRSFSSEALKIQDHQVTFRPKLKRQQSCSPGTSRKKKYDSCHDFDAHDPLLRTDDGDGLSRAQSAYDLHLFSPMKARSSPCLLGTEYGDREEVLSQVSVNM